MSNLVDDLFFGTVSRRTFIELAAKAGLALPMANLALAGSTEAARSDTFTGLDHRKRDAA